MTERFPEYESLNCTKCGFADATIEYYPTGLLMGNQHVADNTSLNTKLNHEFLLRTCLRCGYKWQEACLVQKKSIRRTE